MLTDSKTGKKCIRLNEPARNVLEGIPRLDGNPFVICGERPGRHLVNLQKPWRRIRKAAKLDGVRLHDLRHSFASVAASGAPSRRQRRDMHVLEFGCLADAPAGFRFLAITSPSFPAVAVRALKPRPGLIAPQSCCGPVCCGSTGSVVGGSVVCGSFGSCCGCGSIGSGGCGSVCGAGGWVPCDSGSCGSIGSGGRGSVCGAGGSVAPGSAGCGSIGCVCGGCGEIVLDRIVELEAASIEIRAIFIPTKKQAAPKIAAAIASHRSGRRHVVNSGHSSLIVRLR